MSGKLYLVPTPIGNLKDITLRALEVLKNADMIAAEDTRHTLKLLNHFEIKKPLLSYHKFNEQIKSEDIIKQISEGKNIALVTDAGTPGISDPGSVIVRKCIEIGMDFEVLPGATAITTALVYSGLDTSAFIFYGFLPKENKDRSKLMENLKDRGETMIFYEAPHRIYETLSFLKNNLGNRNISLCRELTKLHEEILRFGLDEAVEYYKDKVAKGEFVIVVQGKTKEELETDAKAKWEGLTAQEHIKKYMDEGLSKKDAVKKTAKDRNLSKSEIYRFSIEL
jgi:16S rRNA (cytidine1402-2'-O)-methyltransferase